MPVYVTIIIISLIAKTKISGVNNLNFQSKILAHDRNFRAIVGSTGLTTTHHHAVNTQVNALKRPALGRVDESGAGAHL